MKKNLILLFILLSSTTAKTQSLVFIWDTVRVVNSNSNFGNDRPRVALLPNEVPIVSWGHQNSDAVYFSKWQGNAFSAPVRVNPLGVPAYIQAFAGPAMATYGDTVYISYDHYNPPQFGSVYLQSSFDGGNTWNDTIRVNPLTPNTLARFGTVEVKDSDEVFIAYLQTDSLGQNPDYYLTKSSDGGTNFAPGLNVTDIHGPGVLEPCDCCHPGLAVKDNKIAVVYRNNDNNVRKIYSSLSTDGGVSTDTVMDIDPSLWTVANCPQSGPDAFFTTDSLYTTWMTAATVPARIPVGSMSTTADSAEFGYGILAAPNETSQQNFPRITGFDDVIFTVWERPDSLGLHVVLAWSATGLANLSAPLLPFPHGSNSQGKPDVIFSPSTGILHMVFQNTDEVVYIRGYILNGVEIENPSYAGTIEVYPNPAEDIAELKIPVDHPCKLEVWQTNGTKVLDMEMTPEQHSLNIRDWASGIYLLTVTEGNKIWTGKLMVN